MPSFKIICFWVILFMQFKIVSENFDIYCNVNYSLILILNYSRASV